MAAPVVDLPIGKVLSTITLRVKGLRQWTYRMKLATWFFRMGARLAGVGIIFETTKPGDEWRSFARADVRRSLVDQINEELADGAKLNI